MNKLEDHTLFLIISELGRAKFNLSNRWHCSRISHLGTHLEYVMQKKNRHGNWGQNEIVGLIELSLSNELPSAVQVNIEHEANKYF